MTHDGSGDDSMSGDDTGNLRLLAIETSCATGTLALASGGEVLERTIATAREQTDLVLSFVNELLGDAGCALGDLDAIVFGRGPGSFTGLRVAAAVAQGLSLASGVPIVSVSSLAALAQAGFEHRATSAAAAAGGEENQGAGPIHALCCVDARMGEVYSASFGWTEGLATPAGEEGIGPPDAVEPPDPPYLALGDGFSAHADALARVIEAAEAVETAVVPGARQLLALAEPEIAAGRFLPLEAALPVYLRGSDAWRKS